MLEQGTRGRSHVRAVTRPHIVSDCETIIHGPQAQPIPLPPAMPEAVVRLQLLASSYGVDLHSLTEVIRNDIGLTVQLLNIFTLETGRQIAKSAGIAELIVHLGQDRLRQMAETMDVICFDPGSFESRQWQRFCKQARALARAAEDLARQVSPSEANIAFVAGLLRHIGKVPRLLGWNLQACLPADRGETGVRLLEAWNLPAILADVVRGAASEGSSQRSRSLLSLIETAEQQTWRPQQHQDVLALTERILTKVEQS